MSHDVLDAPPADDQTVLHEAILAVEAKRKATLVQNLTRWRLLVHGMADGKCGGKHLADLAILADELRLPTGALAADVQVVQNHRGNVTLLAQRRQDAEQLRAEAELASKEIEQLERRLKEARWTIQRHRNIESQPSGIMRAIAEQEQDNPRLFGPVDIVAGKMLEANR